MAEFMRIELEGLFACTRESGVPCEWQPLACERCMVEESLGRLVDRRWPDDHAIARALQIEAEVRDYEAVGRVDDILAADREERLLTPDERRLPPAERWTRSAERRDQLLPSAEFNDRAELASVAFENLVTLQSSPEFADAQQADLQALHAWHRRGGEPPELSPATTRQAKRRIAQRRRAATRTKTGEIRVSSTDRRRAPALLPPSYSKQLGRIRAEQDEHELRRLVRQLRHQARQRGLLPRDYDRRRKGGDLRQPGRTKSRSPWATQGSSDIARMLRQASRGTDREAAELRALRKAPELAPTDARRAHMEERFSTLSRKQMRRAAFRQSILRVEQGHP
jgi:hypothetical protein